MVGVPGCQKTSPLEMKVSANTPGAFESWRTTVGYHLTAVQWHDFDDAWQEIKLQVMAAREATGGEAIDEAARAKIHGATVGDVLRAGGEAKLRRLGAERAELLGAIEQNSRLTVKPGDTESAGYLERIRQRQADHLQRLTQDLTATEQKLKSLPKPGATATGSP
jgi:hypothetical protein